MHNPWYTSIPSWRPNVVEELCTYVPIDLSIVDIMIANEHADHGGIIYRSSRVNSLRVVKITKL